MRRWRATRARAAALAGLALLVALFLLFERAAVATPAPSAPPPAAEAPALAVHFSDPESATALRLRGGPDAALVEAIDAAEHTLDVAVYSLNLWSVRDALLRAGERGVAVRLVLESDNRTAPEVLALERAGIPLRGDERQGLMHHKFVVIDGRQVWMGSMNLTVGSAYHDDNHLLRLDSPEAAALFTREFEEMFVDDRFGALSRPDPTPRPRPMGAGWVEVWFSPDHPVEDRLVELVRGAHHSVGVLAFAFTSDRLGRALIDAAGAGVQVRAVVEAGQAGAAGAEFERLRRAGLDIHLDGNPSNMHHKLILIDGAVAVVGSYNFTRSAAQYNDESLLILSDPQIVQALVEEFERVYALAAPD